MAPIKNADGYKNLPSKDDIASRWMEYFQKLLNRPSTASVDALQSFELPVEEALGSEQTMAELSSTQKDETIAVPITRKSA